MKFGEIKTTMLNYKEMIIWSLYRGQQILRVTSSIWPPELKGILRPVQLRQTSQF